MHVQILGGTCKALPGKRNALFVITRSGEAEREDGVDEDAPLGAGAAAGDQLSGSLQIAHTLLPAQPETAGQATRHECVDDLALRAESFGQSQRFMGVVHRAFRVAERKTQEPAVACGRTQIRILAWTTNARRQPFDKVLRFCDPPHPPMRNGSNRQ